MVDARGVMMKNKGYLMSLFFFALGVGAALFLLVIANKSHAEDIVLNWPNPTQTEECVNAGPLTNLAGTRIWQLVVEINDPDVETYTIYNQVPGTYQYVGTSFDENGLGSRISGTLTKVVDSFFAPAGATAYQVVTISSGFWMIPMATMDADTPCDTSQSANGHYRVPPGSYSWNDGTTARPVMLMAQCQ